MNTFSSQPETFILVQLLWIITSLLLAPLLPNVINKVKAFFAGRNGPPLFQLYYDLYRLFNKRSVWAECSTFATTFSPVIAFLMIFLAFLCLPATPLVEAVFSIRCDFIFLIGFLAIARFVMICAALDSGSSFQGMGAVREMTLSVLIEPAIILVLMSFVVMTKECSLSTISYTVFSHYGYLTATNLLLFVVLFIVMLFECSRIPFDDPNTHLELTMIHEVMILDYSGPMLGLIEYTSAFKLWFFSTFISILCFPIFSSLICAFACSLLFPFLMAFLIGCIESSFARTRIRYLPRLLFVCLALSFLAFIATVMTPKMRLPPPIDTQEVSHD